LLSACEPLGPIPNELDEPVVSTQSGLFIQPTTLDFSAISVADIGELGPSLMFTITNVGDDARTVYNHTNVLTDDALESFSIDAEPFFDLNPGDSTTIPVTFTPPTFGPHSAELRINNEEELFVNLSGQGSAPVIELEAAPPLMVPIGCSESVSVSVHNAGDEPLIIDDIQLSNTTDYTLLSTPTAIAPGESDPIELSFNPIYSPGADTAAQRDLELVVFSNDPFTPQRAVSFDIVAQESFAETKLTYYPGLAVDMLVAIDNTGITSAHLQKAEESFSILVETMDLANVHMNAAIITGGQACPYTTPVFATADAEPSAVTQMLIDGLDGSSGSGSNQLLSHSATALSQSSEAGCLEGFLREDALLHILIISGQADQSNAAIDNQLSNIWEQAHDANDVVISAIVVTTADGCQGASYGEGYTDASISTGGEIGNLCDDSWAGHMESIGRHSGSHGEGGMVAYLDHSPVMDTITVKVDGVTWEHWVWDEPIGAVIFSEEHAPDTGSAIQISYLQAQECDQ
jgi:hypothetical protein